MILDNCKFPMVISYKGINQDEMLIKYKSINDLLNILIDLPLIFGENPELEIFGDDSYIKIVPAGANVKIDKIQVSSNGNSKEKVFFEYVSNDSYRLKCGKTIIDIEKRNKEGILEEKILNLEQRL